MQPTEAYNVSRRALDVEDYIDILRRHKGWIFGPFLFTLVVSVVGAYTWPETFVSRGVVKVEAQQIPESLVQSTAAHDMTDRINSMEESIESVSKLTEIITTFNLYLKERSREPLQDVVEEMKKNIHVEALGQTTNRQVPAFAITFSYTDRHQTQKVVQELITRFLDEHTHSQNNTTYQSTDFLKTEAGNAQKELDAVEVRLAAYKMENNGRLPEQRTENYQKLNTLENSQSHLIDQINQKQAEKLMYENNLKNYTMQADLIAKIGPDPTAVTQQKSARLARAEQEVEIDTTNLQVQRQKYLDDYPTVKEARAFLEAAEKKRDDIVAEERAEADAKKDTTGKQPMSAASAKEATARQVGVAQYQNLIAADQTQIEQFNGELKNVNAAVKALQARLDSVPQSEKEYDDLLREQSIKKANYEAMTKKLQEAQLSQEMEDRQEGEKLEILDAASLPETASDPKRPLVIGIGAGIGLMLGIVIAGAREMKDTSLKNLKDVRAYTQMAILGSIPLLENDFVVRRRRRLAWLGWTTACLTAVVLMSGSVVYYISTKQ